MKDMKMFHIIIWMVAISKFDFYKFYKYCYKIATIIT